MAVNNDTIIYSLHQLETLLFHGNLLDEIESHPLISLRDQLESINPKPDSRTIDEDKKLIAELNYFEINAFYHLIKQYSLIVPSTLLTALFDVIRFKISMDMETYPSICEYYFDWSLTYLAADSTINYLIDTKHVPSNMDEYFLALFSRIGHQSVCIKSHISYSMSISQKKTPTFFQLNDSTERLLQAFIIYLNNYFLNNHQQCQSHFRILNWILNMTDIYGFVPYFVKTGYPNALSQWMSIKHDERKDISLELWDFIFGILYNLTRHWSGVEALNKCKMINTLKQWKEQYALKLPVVEDDNEHDKEILITYYLAYLALLEPKELKKESISNVQTILDYILEQTIQAFNSANLFCGSYNVCEFLEGLAKMVVNDAFLIYIISREGIYELFIEKFLLFNAICESTTLNTMICSSLYTIIWSISFQPEYSMKLKSTDKLISTVEQRVKNESNDEYALEMKRVAKGILFNLDCLQMDAQATAVDPNGDDNRIKVMISYAHRDITFCEKIVAKLQKYFQGDIWVDFNKLSVSHEDDWEDIAKAISQCDVILMIVTENYCSSKSCRREVIHADKRNKRMIPIYQGNDYKAEDWFEIRAGSATWVRFGDKKSDEAVMESLLKLIDVQDKVKQHDSLVPVRHESHFHSTAEIDANKTINIQTVETLLPINSNSITEVSNIQLHSSPSVTSHAIPASPIEQWTSDEVQQWLRLPPSTLQLSSGRALLAYMKLLSHDDAQNDEYETRMRHHGVSREQFSNLISSFASVCSLNNIKTISNELSDQWTREEIKTWFQQNHLSSYLLDTLDFTDGSQLITYGQLVVNSPSRIGEEYDRLKNKIGKDLFHLDEYARLLNGLKKLVSQSKLKEEPSLCNIL
ncbi:unnamed protein product [Rotaria socialis]|uniref:TIR domain-containing protein n=2 Tax=Rotaria socialis TaxID=392032 RepID=A0A820XJJ7_9BILA|nr:unnamed protein product [Rotaria socialis]CAF4533742.1 unnamed protein product [Rotaria socialis]